VQNHRILIPKKLELHMGSSQGIMEKLHGPSAVFDEPIGRSQPPSCFRDEQIDLLQM
jgi:hypothetical protein